MNTSKNIKDKLNIFDNYVSNSPRIIDFLLKFKKFNSNPLVDIHIENKKYIVKIANTSDEIFQIFRLRSKSFKKGFIKNVKDFNLENDIFDEFSDYLIVKDKDGNKVIGTYRLISSVKTNNFYSESEFNLNKIKNLDGLKIELGRACTDKNSTSPIVFALLWKGLLEYSKRLNAKYLFGCSSIFCKSEYSGIVFDYLLENNWVHNKIISMPKNKYMPKIKEINRSINISDIKIPTLIKSYLKAGAKICSFPAYDNDFKCIDLLTLFNLQDIELKYEKKFSQ